MNNAKIAAADQPKHLTNHRTASFLAMIRHAPTRHFILLSLALLLLGMNILPKQSVQAAPLWSSKVSASLAQALQNQAAVPVIVTLVDPVGRGASSSQRVQQLRQVSQSVLAGISSGDFKVYYQYSHVPALAGLADPRAIAALQANPQVAFVQIDERIQAHLGQSVPAIGADKVHSIYNLTGQGVRVAVLDTGISTTHPDLRDSIVAQHCFSRGSTGTGDCPPGPTRTMEGTSAEDENGHGSNVSGIITSNGVVSSVGFAPNAGIVAVRVLDANESGWASDWLAGLNWLIANQGTLHINMLNMSLGTFTLYSGNCDAQQLSSANALAQLHNLGVTIFASSGNQGSLTQIAFPACASNVIAVGATYDGNVGRQPFSGTYATFFNIGWPACADAVTSLQTITCFTNSSSMLDVLAPGAPITSDSVGSGLSTFWGTSQASPTAAGVAALMLQAIPTLTSAQIETTLKSTGTLITDTRNGSRIPLINALTAVQSLLAPPQRNYFTNSMPTFTWTGLSDAVRYEIQIANNSLFINPTTGDVGNVLSFTWLVPIADGSYFWRVRGCRGDTEITCGAWSATDVFTVDTQ